MKQWWMVAVVGLSAAAVGCAGGGGGETRSVRAFCDRVDEFREHELTSFSEDAVDGLRELRDLAPGEVAGDLSAIVDYSEDLLDGDGIPSVEDTKEVQGAGIRLRRYVKRQC
jgi:hypothetical protein